MSCKSIGIKEALYRYISHEASIKSDTADIDINPSAVMRYAIYLMDKSNDDDFIVIDFSETDIKKYLNSSSLFKINDDNITYRLRRK